MTRQPRTHPDRYRQLLQQALRHHHSGQPAQAGAIYRRLLRADPKNADLLHLNGVVALQTGRPQEAQQLIARAVALAPDKAEFHLNLGLAAKALQDTDAALQHLATAVTLKPDFAAAHFNLAALQFAAGQTQSARAGFERAVALNPKHTDAHNGLGNVLKAQGQLDAAADCYRRVLALNPNHGNAHNNLANVLHLQAQPEQALEHYQHALRLLPGNDAVRNNLANLQLELGQAEAALKSYRQVVQRFPDSAQAHYNLANALLASDRLETAAEAYRRALELDPNQPQAHNNLGIALFRQNRLAAAAEHFQQALAVAPDYFEALDNLTDTVLKQCAWEELQPLAERLLAPLRADPSGPAPRPFLVARLPLPISAAERLRVGQAMTRQRTAKLRPTVSHADPQTLAGERLRIGYISTDFNNHATSHLIHDLFGRHDRTRFKVFAYSIGTADDSDYRQKVIAGCDSFRDLQRQTDGAIARQIAADKIAMLIDLNGYSAANRIELFALRPAPVQIVYLGFPSTTGADFFDYIITDRYVTPDDRQAFFSERFITLPHSYQVNSPRPTAADPPDRRACGLPEQGFVFCCFNNHYKIEPRIFARWAAILKAVPDSLLWLLDGPPEVRQNLRRAAQSHGLAAERLVFAPRLPVAEHMARHRHAGLFLDTYFYNAHTTASDALWAGLPVLTCPGDGFAARVGLSLVTAAGLPELAVADLDRYQSTAIALAQRPAELAALRERLAANRDRCPLFDTAGFAAALERALEQVWARRLAAQPPASITINPEGDLTWR